MADVAELNGHLASLFHANIDAFHDEVHDWRYAEDVAANYFGAILNQMNNILHSAYLIMSNKAKVLWNWQYWHNQLF